MPHQHGPSPVSVATEAEQDLEEEHENMKNLLISQNSSLTCEPGGMRRSRAVRSECSPDTMSHNTPSLSEESAGTQSTGRSS